MVGVYRGRQRFAARCAVLHVPGGLLCRRAGVHPDQTRRPRAGRPGPGAGRDPGEQPGRRPSGDGTARRSVAAALYDSPLGERNRGGNAGGAGSTTGGAPPETATTSAPQTPATSAPQTPSAQSYSSTATSSEVASGGQYGAQATWPGSTRNQRHGRVVTVTVDGTTMPTPSTPVVTVTVQPAPTTATATTVITQPAAGLFNSAVGRALAAQAPTHHGRAHALDHHQDGRRQVAQPRRRPAARSRRRRAAPRPPGTPRPLPRAARRPPPIRRRPRHRSRRSPRR